MDMKDIFLVNYSVKGIKTLDKLVSLSFYKKIISKKRSEEIEGAIKNETDKLKKFDKIEEKK